MQDDPLGARNKIFHGRSIRLLHSIKRQLPTDPAAECSSSRYIVENVEKSNLYRKAIPLICLSYALPRTFEEIGRDPKYKTAAAAQQLYKPYMIFSRQTCCGLRDRVYSHVLCFLFLFGFWLHLTSLMDWHGSSEEIRHYDAWFLSSFTLAANQKFFKHCSASCWWPASSISWVESFPAMSNSTSGGRARARLSNILCVYMRNDSALYTFLFFLAAFLIH